MIFKRSFWFVFSLVLTFILAWSVLQPTKSFATLPASPVPSDTQISPSKANLIAQAETGEFLLPPLRYAYDALSPYIDSETMTFHHDKHHAAYVRNLNGAIAKHPELTGRSLESLLRDLDNIPADIRTTVRNNGGGHANHTMFWSIMTPDSPQPTGPIVNAISETFGDFETFKQEFNSAGKSRFGSGWVWLILTQAGTLKITSTANQDSPYFEGDYPIMGNDVWEHAYYLNYQNRRGDYLDAWWNVLNWDEINRRYVNAQASLSS